MTDLKTVLVDAFKEANLRPDYGSMELVGRPCLGAQSVIGTRTASSGHLGLAFDLDRLAQAITDHLTQSSVWEVSLYGDFSKTFRSEAKAEVYLAKAILTGDPCDRDGWEVREIIIHDDEAADRLIEGLAEKATDRPIHD